MLLSHYSAAAGYTTLRDGEFDNAGKASSLAPRLVVPLSDITYLDGIQAQPHIVGVITTQALADQVPAPLLLATAANPKKAIIALHETLVDTGHYAQKNPSVVDASAEVHPTAYIAPYNVVIGKNCIIGPHATILENVVIGDHVRIYSNVTVGADGFDVTTENGITRLIHQAGRVEIGNHVCILANCAISHGTFAGVTRLEDNVMLDNLVHVAHDVKIGVGCKVAAGVTISGSVTIGRDVWIGPGATISNALTIGDEAFISLGAVVTRDVKPKEHLSGNFAVDHSRFIQFIKSIR